MRVPLRRILLLAYLSSLSAFGGVVPVLAQAVETEPNDGFENADALALEGDLLGGIGVDGDGSDYFRVILPEGGALSLAVDFTSAAGTDAADGFAQVFDGRQRALSGGFAGIYDIPDGQTRSDTLDFFGRAPGDTLYVRIYQQSGSLDYVLRAADTPPTTAPDPEPNEGFGEAVALEPESTARGQIGYVRSGRTDRDDYYRLVLPEGGTVELAAAFTSTAGNDGADGLVQVFDARQRALSGGFAGIYDVFAGATRGDTLRLFGRAPGDTLYVRVYQQSGSLDYALRYAVTAPGVGSDDEPNDSFGEATALAPATEVRGQIGYVRDGQTDRNDYYSIALPAGGSVRVIASFTSTAGNDGADGLVQLSDARRTALGGGFAGIYDVPAGQTRADTLDVFGRGPGDTLYVRVYQQSGSLDYTLRYASTDPPRARDEEPNDGFDAALALAADEMASGQIGYVRDGVTDLSDYYRVVMPDGGTFRLAVAFTSTAGGDGADGLVQLSDSRRRALAGGFAGRYDVPAGETRADTLTVRCRAPGDTVYVRVYQQSGSLTYDIEAALEPPPFADDAEPNDALATATTVAVPGTYEGRVGYVGGGTTDLSDYYAFESAGAVSLRIEADLWSDNGTGGTDFLLQALDGEGRALSGGFAAAYDLPEGASRRVFEVRCLPEGTKTLRVYQQNGCVAYRLRLLLRDEQPVADIDVNRLGNRASFGTPGRPDDVLAWDFDNGETSPRRFPTQTFAIGVYEVKLAATNQRCRLTSRDTVTVNVDGVERYQPRRAGKPGPIGFFSVQVFGGGLTDGASVTLSRGGATVEPQRLALADGSEATAVFSFRDVTPGAYDLEVETASGERFGFPGGFTVYDDEDPLALSVQLVGPSRVRTNRFQRYALEVTNASDRMANGAYVGLVIPPGFETDLGDELFRRSGAFTLKGDAWDELTLERESFEEEYFQGDFDPNRDTLRVDFERMKAFADLTLAFPLDSLFDEPFEGLGHLILLPAVRAQSTARVEFRMRGTESSIAEIATYILPYTARVNPVTNAQLDYIHDGGMAAAAALEYAPNPALRAFGRSAGWVDVGTKGLFQVATDAWYGTVSTDAYKDIAVDAGFEYATSKLPFQRRADAYEEAGEMARRRLIRAQESVELIQETVVNSGGRLSQGMGRRLRDELIAHQDYLDALGGALDEAAKEEVIARLRDKLAKQGIKLTKKAIEEILDPEEPSDPEDPPKPATNEPPEIPRFPIRAANSFDPNAIYGPDGAAAARYVRRAAPMGYEVTYENVDTAEIPAQVVRVELTLDPAVYDLSRTRLGGIHVGGRAFGMPAGRSEFFRDVDLRPTQPFVVRVSAKLDTVSGDMTWTFATLDPETLDVPADPFAGYLPPNETAPEGEGGFFFTAFLRDGLTTGDTARTGALIYFDDNEPIATGDWVNVVDETAPRSSALAATLERDSVVVLSHGGTDRGAGIERSYLRVRLDDNPWSVVDFPLDPSGTTEITVDPTRKYDFYVESRDSVGLRERKTPTAEVAYRAGGVTVDIPEVSAAPRFRLSPNPVSSAEDGLLHPRDLTGRARLELFDPLGRRVRASAVELSGGAAVPVPTRGLPAGMYAVRVMMAGGEEVGTEVLVVR